MRSTATRFHFLLSHFAKNDFFLTFTNIIGYMSVGRVVNVGVFDAVLAVTPFEGLSTGAAEFVPRQAPSVCAQHPVALLALKNMYRNES